MDKLKKKDIGREWGKVPTVARYADLSPRTVRQLIKSGEIRHSKLATGTILIKFDWVNEFLEKKEIRDNSMDRIISDVLTHFK